MYIVPQSVGQCTDLYIEGSDVPEGMCYVCNCWRMSTPERDRCVYPIYPTAATSDPFTPDETKCGRFYSVATQERIVEPVTRYTLPGDV